MSIRRRLIASALAVATMTGVIGVVAPIEPAGATRGGLVPLAGTATVVQTPLTQFANMLVDDANQQVLVSSGGDGTVIAFRHDGSVRATRTGLAGVTEMVLGGGHRYALLEAAGQIVRLDPTTLAPTPVVSGLTSATGLAYTSGALFTSAQIDGAFWIVRVDPATGAVTRTVFGGERHMRLYAFARYPDCSGPRPCRRCRGTSPGSTWRRGPGRS